MPLIIPPAHSHSTVPITGRLQSSNEKSNTDTPLNGIVKRRVKNLKGQRNRKSALHGEDFLFDATGSLGDMKIQLLSISPEHQGDLVGEGGVVMESRVGKVLDLVKQFDEAEPMEDKGRVSSPGAGDGASVRKLSSDAFDVFQKSGIIMGMVRGEGTQPNCSSSITWGNKCRSCRPLIHISIRLRNGFNSCMYAPSQYPYLVRSYCIKREP